MEAERGKLRGEGKGGDHKLTLNHAILAKKEKYSLDSDSPPTQIICAPCHPLICRPEDHG
jgi:hypothetical protein